VNGVDRADVGRRHASFTGASWRAPVMGRQPANGLDVDRLAAGRQSHSITNSARHFGSALYLACSANTLKCRGAWSMKRPGPTSSLPSRS